MFVGYTGVNEGEAFSSVIVYILIEICFVQLVIVRNFCHGREDFHVNGETGV
jgi:hypothetical protein